ncbi:MAG: methyltransferase [Zhongshania sp.]|uniref:methyltransferase n=1 Tax=Zhongshania sp. TaxID=1971902 RepID=UPI00261F5214|nr:methyltransferase [Zhongshania sp.]MDF1692390.1 methyltransferase [Zhongshania sp.]
MDFALCASRLDALLLRYQACWQFNAYSGAAAPHLGDHSALTDYLQTLSHTDIPYLQGDDHALLHALKPYFSPAAELIELIGLAPICPNLHPQEPPAGIPGRKWQQINAFLAAQAAMHRPVLEWCSGKSYLGEAIHRRYQLPITALEIDTQLVAAGNARAQGSTPLRQIIRCDVLSDDVHQQLSPTQHLVALHACGGLHQRLLSLAVEHSGPQLSLAPCCYHRFTENYEPLSRQLKASTLRISNHDLRSAVRQTNTARSGETQARRTLQAWHLGLRELLPQLGIAKTTPLPSLPQHWSKRSFGEFAQALLDKKNINITLPTELANAEQAGWQQLHRAEAIDLVRMAFRRALELRCVLDSLLFLQENGYQCTLSEFCSPTLSPRNLLIQAQKSPYT